jgi:hypothetical protein
MSNSTTAVCPQCGSLRTRSVSANPLQWILALLRGQRVITCHRCGWRGRQSPLKDAPARRADGGGSRPSARAIDYAALDRAMALDESRVTPPQDKA